MTNYHRQKEIKRFYGKDYPYVLELQETQKRIAELEKQLSDVTHSRDCWKAHCNDADCRAEKAEQKLAEAQQKIAELEKQLGEEQRLNSMGGEREYGLRGQIQRLEKQLAEAKWRPSLKIHHTGKEKVYGVCKLFVDGNPLEYKGGQDD